MPGHDDDLPDLDFGVPLGACLGVVAYSNLDDYYFSGEKGYCLGVYTGYKYQCVEYARRSMLLRFGCIFGQCGPAHEIFDMTEVTNVHTGRKHPFVACPNGKTTVKPVPGMTLIYPIDKKMPVGHVAVISEVGEDWVGIAEENEASKAWSGKPYGRTVKLLHNPEDGTWTLEETDPHFVSCRGWLYVEGATPLPLLPGVTDEDMRTLNPKSFNNQIYTQLPVLNEFIAPPSAPKKIARFTAPVIIPPPHAFDGPEERPRVRLQHEYQELLASGIHRHLSAGERISPHHPHHVPSHSATRAAARRVPHYQSVYSPNEELGVASIGQSLRCFRVVERYVAELLAPCLADDSGAEAARVSDRYEMPVELVCAAAKQLRSAERAADCNRATATVDSVAAAFNSHPDDGFTAAVQRGILQGREPDALAAFLLTHPGLNKHALGTYLADSGHQPVLEAYVRGLGLAGPLLDALRAFVHGFTFPTEAKRVDYLLEHFARAWTAVNPTVFQGKDTAFMLAYNIVLLNSDLTNPKIRTKINREGFVKMNAGIDGGKDLPLDLLGSIFDAIVSKPLRYPPATDCTGAHTTPRSVGTGDFVMGTLGLAFDPDNDKYIIAHAEFDSLAYVIDTNAFQNSYADQAGMTKGFRITSFGNDFHRCVRNLMRFRLHNHAADGEIIFVDFGPVERLLQRGASLSEDEQLQYAVERLQGLYVAESLSEYVIERKKEFEAGNIPEEDLPQWKVRIVDFDSDSVTILPKEHRFLVDGQTAPFVFKLAPWSLLFKLVASSHSEKLRAFLHSICRHTDPPVVFQPLWTHIASHRRFLFDLSIWAENSDDVVDDVAALTDHVIPSRYWPDGADGPNTYAIKSVPCAVNPPLLGAPYSAPEHAAPQLRGTPIARTANAHPIVHCFMIGGKRSTGCYLEARADSDVVPPVGHAVHPAPLIFLPWSFGRGGDGAEDKKEEE